MNTSCGSCRSRPIAVILGLDEIASAIAVRVHEAGYSVVMSHDAARPVIRRGMAFINSLYDDPIVLGGLPGIAVHNALEARAKVPSREGHSRHPAEPLGAARHWRRRDAHRCPHARRHRHARSAPPRARDDRARAGLCGGGQLRRGDRRSTAGHCRRAGKRNRLPTVTRSRSSANGAFSARERRGYGGRPSTSASSSSRASLSGASDRVWCMHRSTATCMALRVTASMCRQGQSS